MTFELTLIGTVPTYENSPPPSPETETKPIKADHEGDRVYVSLQRVLPERTLVIRSGIPKRTLVTI